MYSPYTVGICWTGSQKPHSQVLCIYTAAYLNYVYFYCVEPLVGFVLCAYVNAHVFVATDLK